MEIVSTSATFDNIHALMLKCLGDFDRLRSEDLVQKLINIGCNNSNIFQGHKTGVTQQFQEKVSPFVMRVHYFAHKTNLAVIILSNVLLVHRLELLIQSLYAFFAHSPKKFVKFQKLAKLLQTKGNKFLYNVKTCWITMLSPTK
jgi:hypothetical protein